MMSKKLRKDDDDEMDEESGSKKHKGRGTYNLNALPI